MARTFPEQSCIFCQKPFTPVRRHQRFCSSPCRFDWHNSAKAENAHILTQGSPRERKS